MDNKDTTYISSILSLEDLDLATTSLTELSFINPNKAKELAVEILIKHRGDEHLQASAFDVLYAKNQNAAINMADAIVKDTNIVVLMAIMDNITTDSLLLDEHPKMRMLIEKINKRIMGLSHDETAYMSETLKWFRETFADK